MKSDMNEYITEAGDSRAHCDDVCGARSAMKDHMPQQEWSHAVCRQVRTSKTESSNAENRCRCMRLGSVMTAAILLVMALTLTACGKRARQERELRDFAISLMKDGAYGAAVAKFDEALSMNDGSVGEIEIDILKYRAQTEILMGDYEAAEYTYTLLEREEKKCAEYTNLRIICMARAGKDLGRAIELYEKAEKDDPYGTGHMEALYVLGEALSGSELESQRAKGREFYTAAIEDEKRRSGELYDRLGMMYFDEGNTDGALELFRKGTELIDSDEKYSDDEARRSIMFNIAVCTEYKSDWEGALEIFREYESTYGATDESSHEIAFLEGILSER